MNIWIPAGTAPRGGWPVFIYIHGGWLQWGTPNHAPTALVSMLSDDKSTFRAVVVQPAYRLNAFGFIVSKELEAEAGRNGETVGNLGFWDQRMALEWTKRNIHLFSGNSSNITVSGYSAGSHSTFQQLAYDLLQSKDEPIIKRAIMWSNSPGFQPKTMPAKQEQFDELLARLGIPARLSAEEKLKRLRAVPAKQLVEVQNKMTHSEFRAYTDGTFIAPDMISKLNSGEFGRRMKARGIKLINGECRDEHFIYQQWRTPSQSYGAVLIRLCSDYPEPAVRRLLRLYCGFERRLPAWCTDWQDFFGKVYANLQVHCLERGFMRCLEKGGMEFGKDVLRYRIDWRAGCADAAFPKEWKVTHGTDMAMWYFGQGMADGLTEAEKQAVKPLHDAFASFVKGDDVEWGTRNVKEMKRLRGDGKTDIWLDEHWEEGFEVWDLVNPSQPMPGQAKL